MDDRLPVQSPPLCAATANGFIVLPTLSVSRRSKHWNELQIQSEMVRDTTPPPRPWSFCGSSGSLFSICARMHENMHVQTPWLPQEQELVTLRKGGTLWSAVRVDPTVSHCLPRLTLAAMHGSWRRVIGCHHAPLGDLVGKRDKGPSVAEVHNWIAWTAMYIIHMTNATQSFAAHLGSS